MALLITLMFSISVHAYTSYQTISSDQDGAWGPDSYASDDVFIKGNNYSSSTNTLWVAGQTQGYKVFGHTFGNIPIGIGTTNSRTATQVIEHKYHVILDPAGPLAKGCNGWGYIDD